MLCSDCDNFQCGKRSVNKTKSTRLSVSQQQQQQQQLKQAVSSVPETVLSSDFVSGLDSGVEADTGTDAAKVVTVVNELLST